MLSCSIRNRMFTSRNLKKCALVCTTRVQYRFCLFAIFSGPAPRLFWSAPVHTLCIYLWKGPEMAGKCCSDVINFYSITAGYCCSLDPPFCFTMINERSAFGTSFCTYYFLEALKYTYMSSFFKKLFQWSSQFIALHQMKSSVSRSFSYFRFGLQWCLHG